MRSGKLGAAGLLVAAALGGQLATADTPKAGSPPTAKAVPGARTVPATPQSTATLKAIETQLGFVPQFMRSVPPSLLPMVWDSMSRFQMGTETQLDNKTKELIGLAVAAQVPCDYCIMFHTEAARLNGASEQEIQEAVGMAAITREMSTMLNGLQIDKVQFKRDLDRIVRDGRERKARQEARR